RRSGDGTAHGGRRRARYVLATDSPGGEAGEQRVAMHAEDASRARAIPILALEGAQHVGLLEAVTRVLERQRDRAAVASRALIDLVNGEVDGQIVEPDHGAGGEGDTPLHDILELAHVAGPVVGLERR